MFAATTDDDGKFRLSIRRIRTIKTFHNKHGNPVDITFTSLAKARNCANELNELYVDEFERNWDKREGTYIGANHDEANVLMTNMLDLIGKYTTLDRG